MNDTKRFTNAIRRGPVQDGRSNPLKRSTTKEDIMAAREQDCEKRGFVLPDFSLKFFQNSFTSV